MKEISADKGYLGATNMLASLQKGAIPYIPFKSNSVPHSEGSYGPKSAYSMPEHLSIRYGIIAGEVVGQVRSALEHAVWEMVPNPIEGKTGFPVVWEQRDYPKKRSLMIDGINSSAATAIERVQPFNDGGGSAPLYILNETWKRDKHRVLNIIGQTVAGFQRSYIFDDSTARHIPTTISRKLVDGAEVARIAFPDFYQPPKVRMVAVVAFILEFWDAGPATGKSVDELLRRLVQFGQLLIETLSATV